MTQKNPVQVQFPYALWAREKVATLIERAINIMVSADSVGRSLARLGLTCPKPLHRANECNGCLVRQWLEKEYLQIMAIAKKERAGIYFGYGAQLRSDYHAGRTWGAKGHTLVVQMAGARYRMSLISMVKVRDHIRFMIADKGSIKANRFAEFLQHVIKNTERQIFVIAGRASVHCVKKVSAFVPLPDGKLRLFFLPPYSPDLNPDELMWKRLKTGAVGQWP